MATLIVLGVVTVALLAFVAYMVKLVATTDDRFFPGIFALSAFIVTGIILSHLIN